MKMIKDGTISGRLPSKKIFAVHYPGYPSSISRALETLGGTDEILKARSSSSNKLEVRFRPEDPYSHPVFGKLYSCNHFLVKVSKTKSTGCNEPTTEPSCSNQSSTCVPDSEKERVQGNVIQADCVDPAKDVEAQNPEGDESLCADIIASVPEAYYFDGMADYQHVLPVHAEIARNKKRTWTDMEPYSDKAGLMDIDQENLMMLVPQLFSLKDVPEKLILKKPSRVSSSKKMKHGSSKYHLEMDIEPSLAIDFNIKEIPMKVDWEERVSEDQRESYMAVSRMFDEQPIWHKSSLAEQLLAKGLSFGDYTLRRILYIIGYYFSNGPFIRLWIRKGYDPRKDPESCIYQSVDFRTPPSLRSYCDTNAAKGLKRNWEDICALRVFPYKCQTSLQLCELDDDYIREEIRNSPRQATCSLGSGWFSANLIESFRRRVALRFLSVYPETGAEHLLKAASYRFEKSKRMCIIRESMPTHNEAENHHDSTEVINNEAKQPENAEDIENDVLDAGNDEEDLDADNDEEDLDADNDEEDLDADEAFDLASEDGEFPLQEDSYVGERNVSTTYLQELFGSFPFSGAGGGQNDAEFSDQEYQIYEQDSDNEYSDYDD